MSLAEKLGIKEGMAIMSFNVPEGYTEKIGHLPSTIQNKKKLLGMCDLIHFFALSRSQLENQFPILKKHLYPTGMLWISWPKLSSNLKTDLNENNIRDIGLCHGLVDTKVLAVDETWSALKFVFRLKDRPV